MRKNITRTFETEKEARKFTIRLSRDYHVTESNIKKLDDSHYVLEAILDIEDEEDAE